MHRDLHAAYFKKTVDARWQKRRVKIDLADDVFSSHQLDVGSRFLLRQMDKALVRYQRALDVGCGYGLLGLYLAGTGRCEQVMGFDRDALAVEFANHNAQQNDITNAQFHAGLAYEANAPADYDLIVTNLPAKAGDGVHRLMLLGAQQLLCAGGEVWTVVVDPLEDRIDAMLDHANIDVRAKESRGGHIVYRFAFAGPAPHPDRPYDRGHVDFRYKKMEYDLDAWWGLAEFDTRSIDTDLMLTLVADHVRRGAEGCAAIINSGQGHLPVFISRYGEGEVDLVIQNRDALADAATAHNLQLNGHAGQLVRAVTAAFPLQRGDLVPGLVTVKLNSQVRDTTSAAMVATWFEQLPECTMIAGGPAAYVNRVGELLARRHIGTKRKVKQRGFAAMRLARR